MNATIEKQYIYDFGVKMLVYKFRRCARTHLRMFYVP